MRMSGNYTMKTPRFEFSRKRPQPGDRCLIVGFSFEVKGSMSNLMRPVMVIKNSNGVCMCTSTDGGRPLRNSDEYGRLNVPEKWLLPLNPGDGGVVKKRPKAPSPFTPSFA